HPAAELGQHHHPQPLVLQVDRVPGVGGGFGGDPLVEGQRVDPPGGALVDALVQVGRQRGRLLRQIGRQGEPGAPDSDRLSGLVGGPRRQVDRCGLTGGLLGEHVTRLGRATAASEWPIRRYFLDDPMILLWCATSGTDSPVNGCGCCRARWCPGRWPVGRPGGCWSPMPATSRTLRTMGDPGSRVRGRQWCWCAWPVPAGASWVRGWSACGRVRRWCSHPGSRTCTGLMPPTRGRCGGCTSPVRTWTICSRRCS